MVAGGYSQVTVYIFYSLIAVACAVAGIVGAGFFSGTRGRGGNGEIRSRGTEKNQRVVHFGSYNVSGYHPLVCSSLAGHRGRLVQNES